MPDPIQPQSVDPCAAEQQKVDDLADQLEAMREAYAYGEVPQPRTPANIARFNAYLRTLSAQLRAASLALSKCKSANHPTLYVQGRFLHAHNGDVIILRGVNLPLLDDWSFPGSDYLSELAQTGANAVRLQWYVHYPSADRPAYSIDDLDGVLTRCKAAGMIPIVELGDLTCQADPKQLNVQLIPWWTSSDVVAVLKKHSDYLILNLANELGYYHWAGDSAAALSSYVGAYSAGLSSIRGAGLAMPVMIDAPDCGSSLDAFVSAGASLVAADPAHNVLLSVHAYWAATDYTGSLASCVNLNLPVVCGEIANKQDDTDSNGDLIGYYDLDGSGQNVSPPSQFTYQALLTKLKADQIGWLAWSWGPDKCAARKLSSDGTFAALTPYGQDIVHNPDYGLLATAVRVTG